MLVGRKQIGDVGQAIQSPWADGFFLGHKDQAMFFDNVYRHETVTFIVYVRETLAVWDMLQATVQAIGPAVISTDEVFGATAPLGHLHAAMAARIPETAHGPVIVPDDNERSASGYPGDIIAVVGYCGGRTEGNGQVFQ